MQSRRMHTRGAFTIAETLISLVLLVLVMTGGMAAFRHAVAWLQLSVHKKMAVEMVNSRLEEIKDYAYSAVVDAPIESVTVGDFSAKREVFVTIPVHPVTGAPVNYKQVRVKVTWKDAAAVSDQEYEASTIIAP